MNVGFLIIIGITIGFIASKIRGPGVGLWWGIYLGVAGSAFIGCVTVFAYFVNVLPRQDAMGVNLFSIAANTAGATVFIGASRFYKKIINYYNQRILPRKILAVG